MKKIPKAYNVNIDEITYDEIKNILGNVYTGLEEVYDKSKVNPFNGDLLVYYNNLNIDTDVRLLNIMNEIEELKLKIDASLNAYKNIDKELMFGLDSIIEEIFNVGEESGISSEFDELPTYEEKREYLDNLIKTCTNTLEELLNEYNSLYGEGIVIQDSEQFDTWFNVINAMGVFDRVGFVPVNLYNENGNLDIDNLGRVLTFCKDNNVSVKLKSYLVDNNGWYESHMSDFNTLELDIDSEYAFLYNLCEQFELDDISYNDIAQGEATDEIKKLVGEQIDFSLFNTLNSEYSKCRTLQNDILNLQSAIYNYEQYQQLMPFEESRRDLEYLDYLTKDYSNYDNEILNGSMYGGKYKDYLGYMDQSEVALYDYIYTTQGSDVAETYLFALTDTINQRKGFEKAYNYVSHLNQGGLDVGDFFVSGWEGFKDGNITFFNGINNFFNADGVISDFDYEMLYKIELLNSNEYKKYTNNLDDGAKKLLSYNYQINNSIGNMTIPMLVSFVPVVGKKASSALMWTSTTGNATEQALQGGASKANAYLYGSLIGLSEVTLERLMGGIPGLSDKAQIGFKNFVKDMLGEAKEEGIQTWVEAFLKTAVLGEEVDLTTVASDSIESALMGMFVSGQMKLGVSIPVTIGNTVIKVRANGDFKVWKNNLVIPFKNVLNSKYLKGDLDKIPWDGLDDTTKDYILERRYNEIKKLPEDSTLKKELISHAGVNEKIAALMFEDKDFSFVDHANNDIASKYLDDALKYGYRSFPDLAKTDIDAAKKCVRHGQLKCLESWNLDSKKTILLECLDDAYNNGCSDVPDLAKYDVDIAKICLKHKQFKFLEYASSDVLMNVLGDAYDNGYNGSPLAASFDVNIAKICVDHNNFDFIYMAEKEVLLNFLDEYYLRGNSKDPFLTLDDKEIMEIVQRNKFIRNNIVKRFKIKSLERDKNGLYIINTESGDQLVASYDEMKSNDFIVKLEMLTYKGYTELKKQFSDIISNIAIKDNKYAFTTIYGDEIVISKDMIDSQNFTTEMLLYKYKHSATLMADGNYCIINRFGDKFIVSPDDFNSGAFLEDVFNTTEEHGALLIDDWLIDNIESLGSQLTTDQQTKIAKQIEKIAQSCRVDSETVRAAINKALDNIVKQSKFGTRSSLQTLELVLNSRIKNQHETGTSDGYNNPKARRKVEDAMFGIPETLDASDAPIYGMLFPDLDIVKDYSEAADYYKNGPGYYYGSGGGSSTEAVIIFDKSKIIKNTTITIGDSADYGPYNNGEIVKGTAASSPQFTGAYSGFLGGIKTISKIENADLYTFAPRLGSSDQYVEIQVFGQYAHSFDVIDEVIFLKQPDSTLTQQLDTLGIKYRILN